MDRTIKKIIIHCSATREGQDISVDTIRDWHLKRGWSDIGYHYVIDLNGVVRPGRPVEKTRFLYRQKKHFPVLQTDKNTRALQQTEKN